MKLSDGDKVEIKKMWGEWESVHGYYDDLMKGRLKELDPEFLEDLEKEFAGATFWYA